MKIRRKAALWMCFCCLGYAGPWAIPVRAASYYVTVAGLGGEPDYEQRFTALAKDLDKLLIGENVREILDCDLRLEQTGITRLREAIAYCEGVRDFVSRDLFSDILQGEEDQVDFIETQFELIDRIGLERYIQLQSSSAD